MKASKNNGSAIAYGLVIIAILSILITGMGQFVVSHIKYTIHVETREQAFHIAESGIYFYRWYLSHQIDGQTPQDIIDFWNNDPIGVGLSSPYIKDYEDIAGNKVGEAKIEVTFPLAGNYNVIDITSTGSTLKKPEVTRTIKATLRRTVWSDFALLTDAPVCLDSYWTINGKIMANKGVHFEGVANNIVLSGVSSYNDNNPMHASYANRNGVWTLAPNPSSVFRAGTKYPVPQKDFNGVTVNLESIKEEARENLDGSEVTDNCNNRGAGCYFDNTGKGRHIILKNDGKFDICTVDEYWTNAGSNHYYPRRYKKISGSGTCNTCSGVCLRENLSLPSEGVIFVDDNIWLEGTINQNRLTIAAASISDPSDDANVFIGVGNKNIRYTNTNGDDVLGIVSEGDIRILEGSADNLKIDAALLSQEGEFIQSEYNAQCCGGGCGTKKNDLDIFGCVISKKGISFGYHKEVCPNIQMERKITYDNNLYLYPPPFFPADSFYYVDFWEEL